MPPKLSKLSKSNFTIENLSCELLVYIFNSLDLIDHLEIRSVCKRWYTIIQNYFKLKELNIIQPYEFEVEYYNNPNDNYKSYGFLNGNAYNPKYNLYLYKSKKSNNLKSKPFKSLLFINLKYLNLNFKLNDQFNIDILHNFKQLIQLEIFDFNLRKNTKIINLPNLHSLAIYNLRLQNTNLLTINCNQLKNLLICEDNLNKIKFNYPNTIINLSIRKQYGNLDGLVIFKNLEIFNCTMTKELNRIDLKLFTNLKELNLYGHYLISGLEALCKYLLIKSEQLKFQIYINDIKIINNEQIINDLNFDLIKVLDDNSKSSIRSLNRFIYQTDITELMNKNLNNDYNLIIKFKNIHTIYFCTSQYEKSNDLNFINLISKFCNLRKLKFYNLSINQNFYDSLPDICPFLIELSFVKDKHSSTKIDHKNLIKNLNYLMYFIAPDNLELDFVLNYFEMNRNFHFIRFLNQDREYTISRKNKNQFKYDWFYLIPSKSKDYLTFEKLKSELL